MKTQLRITLTAAILCIATIGFAQQSNRRTVSIEDRVEKVMQVIEKEIEINETQKLIIEKAFEEFFQSADKEMESGNRPDRAVMEVHEKERDQKLKEVLTEEQYESYLKISYKLKPAKQRQQGGKNRQGMH